MCLQFRTLLSLLLVTSATLAFNVSAAAIVPLSINAGYINTENTTSPVGSNLAPVADYTGEYPFINYFRMARSWFSAPSDFSAFSDTQPLALDSNGNVTSLTPKQFARTVLFTNLPDPGLSGKKLHLYYDGDGELFYGNVKTISQSPGHDVIQLNKVTSPDSTLVVQITLASTNTNNPLRNIRLLPSGGICARNPLVTVAATGSCPNNDFKSFEKFHESILFNPQFLSTIKSYRSIRFMDWMRTNSSTQTQFSDRPLPTHQFWSTDEKGVPLEVMIALANLMDFDPWFTIPHLADDTYVREVASLLNAQLEPKRRAYIEYSNEVWNFIFTQANFALERGKQLGLDILDNGESNTFIGLGRFYSKRSQEIFTIFENVMGGTDRIRRVMAGQAVAPFLTQEIMRFGNAAQMTDVYAIADYFGNVITNATERDEMLKLGVDGVFDWLLNDNNPMFEFSLLGSDRAVRDQIAVLAEFGVPLIAYEGGQHLVAGGEVQRDVGLNALMDAVNRDPRMKTVYLRHLNNWRNRTNQVFNHYVNSDHWSIFGRWGAKEFPTQQRRKAPKYDALLTYIAKRPLK